MGARLRRLSPDINAIPVVNQSLFRLNRDVRFSKDKSPYKTNLGIFFWEGPLKKMECPGYYFHLTAKGLMLYTGIYQFTKEQLKEFRQSVIDKKHGATLRKSLAAIGKKRQVHHRRKSLQKDSRRLSR